MSHTTLLLQCPVRLEMHPGIVPGYLYCLPLHKPSAVGGFAPLPCTIAGLRSWNSTLGTTFSGVFGLSLHRQGPCTPTLPWALLRAPIPFVLRPEGLAEPQHGFDQITDAQLPP